MKLSRRLGAIAAYIPDGAAVADIGTDHAFLPAFLAREKDCRRIIATEVNAGPFGRAVETVNRYGVGEAVELRMGDGLTVLRSGEADIVVIAGIGGTTTVDILEAGLAALSEAKRLVLQPMGGGEVVRRWLAENSYRIVAENLVKEDGRFYEIIVAEPGEAEPGRDIQYVVGPRLLAERHPLLAEYLTEIATHAEQVLLQLGNTDRADVAARREELAARIREIREVIACLQASRP
ncbi:MAG: tRNA (adenine(22)-N(1))-methyltransferase [bacterium]|jgi:tRNA (adenine22-N1)-methyltransferase